MPKPIPEPPDYQPSNDFQSILDLVKARAILPADATSEQAAETVRGLQWLQNEVLDEWLRVLAREQGRGRLTHRGLVEITGYKAHRNVQKRVYEGRDLLRTEGASPQED